MDEGVEDGIAGYVSATDLDEGANREIRYRLKDSKLCLEIIIDVCINRS